MDSIYKEKASCVDGEWITNIHQVRVRVCDMCAICMRASCVCVRACVHAQGRGWFHVFFYYLQVLPSEGNWMWALATHPIILKMVELSLGPGAQVPYFPKPPCPPQHTRVSALMRVFVNTRTRMHAHTDVRFATSPQGTSNISRWRRTIRTHI